MAYFGLGEYAETRKFLEKGLQIVRRYPSRRMEYMFLLGVSLVQHCQNDNEGALKHAQQVLHRPILFAWYYTFPMVPSLILGHALMGLGESTQAADTYRQALDVYQKTGWPRLPMEPLAGLARIALAQGDLPQAQAHVETILEHLKTRTLNGTLEPFRIYLTCVRVLQAAGDPPRRGGATHRVPSAAGTRRQHRRRRGAAPLVPAQRRRAPGACGGV